MKTENQTKSIVLICFNWVCLSDMGLFCFQHIGTISISLISILLQTKPKCTPLVSCIVKIFHKYLFLKRKINNNFKAKVVKMVDFHENVYYN